MELLQQALEALELSAPLPGHEERWSDAINALYEAKDGREGVGRLMAVAREAQALADSVDAWNRDVEAVIGRQPNSGMATAALRLAIAELDRP